MKKAISVRTAVGLAAILCLGLAVPSMAKGPCNSYNVTSILNDADGNSAPFQLQSDGGGPYTSTTNTRAHNDTVTSIIQPSCSWELDTTYSKSRGIVVTLAYPFDGGTSAPFIGPQEIYGRFDTVCGRNPSNNGVNFGNMTFAGQTAACPMVLQFTYNAVLYGLVMAPANTPGTSFMQVTCSGATSGQCNAWTVLPDPATGVLNLSTNQFSAVAGLYLPDCLGCSTGTPLGQYLVSFNFYIHK